MSCYLIKVENGHKVARSITSEEEYKQLRGSNEQKANLRLARAGSDAAKRRLVQFNYSGHYPQGVVKGMKLPSGAFGFDMDEPEAFAKAAIEGGAVTRTILLLIVLIDNPLKHQPLLLTQQPAFGRC